MLELQVIEAQKLVEGQLWAEVTDVAIRSHMNVLPSISQVT